MKKIVKQGFSGGKILIPASKSYFQRAVLAAALSKSTTDIHFYKNSADGIDFINALQSLGVVIEKKTDNQIAITAPEKGFLSNQTIQIGESGLGSRMLLPVLAATGGKYILDGKGSLMNRPFDPVIEILDKTGLDVKSNKGKLPIQIEGKLEGEKFTIPADLSSQFATGFFFALPLLESNAEISLLSPKSLPYIEMTLDLLADFGIHYQKIKDFTWKLTPQQFLSPQHYNVEGDWSGAAFLVVAGVAFGNVTIEGIQKDSVQADAAIMDVLNQIFADYSWHKDQLIIQQSKISAFAFDATHCPDLFPPLAALAAFGDGESCIKGVQRLVHKESNRAEAIQEEFGKMGVKVKISDDIMCVEGGQKIIGAAVDAHNDHRIAMALAILALKAEGETVIEGAESVGKSYATFWEDLSLLQ